MTIIKINNQDEESCPTKDSINYNKDCVNFKCMEDGTILGESRYCNLSLQCRQIDVLANGKVVPMEAHYLPITDGITGEVMSHELFCTGHHDLRPYKERLEDDKVL